jgi:L-lactate dehydrogenase complex protein LldG
MTQGASGRDAILGRVRAALGKRAHDGERRQQADRYITAQGQGPRPRMPSDLVSRFVVRATEMQSSVERVGGRADVAPAVARYLASLAHVAIPPSRRGVCWPEFRDQDWAHHGLTIDARPGNGDDRLGVTGCFCAIAETGTLVVLAGSDTPTATTLLPETHIAVLRSDRIVSGMEDAFALIRKERGQLPRAVNLISGPSRTGDIEQTIVLGAHGPYRVHIIITEM